MWNERYNTSDYVYGREPNDFLREQAYRLQGKVLCLAEGEGRNGVFLARLGCQVTGVDGSEVGMKKAQALAAENGVSINTIVTDLENFVIEPNSWDGVVSIFCHLPSALRARIHRQVVAGLKPGGVLVLEAYRPAQLEVGTGGPSVADMMMTLEALREELQGLHLDVAQEVDRDVVEGRFHTGHAAVVQVVGIKQ